MIAEERNQTTMLANQDSVDFFIEPESKDTGTYKQLREVGSKVEETFGRPIVIVHNQVEYISGYEGRTFQLFIVSSEEFAEYDVEIRNFLHQQWKRYYLKNIPDFYLTSLYPFKI